MDIGIYHTSDKLPKSGQSKDQVYATLFKLQHSLFCASPQNNEWASASGGVLALFLFSAYYIVLQLNFNCQPTQHICILPILTILPYIIDENEATENSKVLA